MKMKVDTSNFNHDGDNLIYLVVALPGGQDGMDSSNKGGPVRAFMTEALAKKWAGIDSRYEIRSTIMNALKLRRSLKKKLSLQEKFYLEILGADLDTYCKKVSL